MCHLSLNFCRGQVSMSGTEGSIPLGLPDYPQSSTLVLQTRAERFQDWMRADQAKGFTRHLLCGLHFSRTEYFEVTGYSLHG